MTVSSTARKAGPFLGNGGTTSFPFAFKIFDKADLLLTLTSSAGVDSTLVLDSAYSVALNADQDAAPGGTVTYPITGAPMPAGTTLTITGNMAATQPMDIVNMGRFLPQVLENELDRATIISQQNQEKLGRALLGSASETAPQGTLPLVSARKGKVLGFDPVTGFPVVSSSTVSQLDATVAAVASAAALATQGGLFLAEGAGAVVRGVQDKLRDTVNVKDFGAVGNGAADDTAAFQAALNRAACVIVPPGTYKLTAPLTMKRESALIGVHPEMCQLFRTTAYGDTIASNPGGSLTIRGLWFRHVYAFDNGASYVPGTSTSVTNKDPTSSHLKITTGQNVRIENCWFSGLGYGINLLDTTVVWITRCSFDGLWHPTIAALQDSSACIYMHSSTYLTRCSTVHVESCNIGGGYGTAAANITTPPGGGAGSVTVSHTGNAGPRYGVWIQSCEEFKIANSYIGGQSQHCIYLDAMGILCHGHIHDNMIDGAAQYSIKLSGNVNTTDQYPNFIEIHHNTAVGYGIDQGFLHIAPFGAPAFAATYINVSNNVVQYYLRAAILLVKAFGVKIANNQVIAYNSDNATAADPTCLAGCYVEATSQYIDSIGNTWGGSVNSPGGANNCRWGIFFAGTTNNTCGLERNNGLGSAGGSLVGGIAQTYPTT